METSDCGAVEELVGGGGRMVSASRTAPLWATAGPERAFCSTSSVVRPLRRSSSRLPKIILRVRGSRPIDGSSKQNTGGSSIMLRAISTFFGSPLDR